MQGIKDRIRQHTGRGTVPGTGMSEGSLRGGGVMSGQGGQEGEATREVVNVVAGFELAGFRAWSRELGWKLEQSCRWVPGTSSLMRLSGYQPRIPTFTVAQQYPFYPLSSLSLYHHLTNNEITF